MYDARVLDVDQVRSQASQLSHTVSISTMRTFSGPKSDFIRSTEQALTGQDAIAIGISVEQRYLALALGTYRGSFLCLPSLLWATEQDELTDGNAVARKTWPERCIWSC